MPSPLEHDYIGFSSSSSNFEEEVEVEDLKGTELRLGLPGSESPERKPVVGLSLGLPKSSVSGLKRGFADTVDGSGGWIFSGGSGGGMENGKGGPLVSQKEENGGGTSGQDSKGHVLSAKAQVVGWPPIRSYRKSMMPTNLDKNKDGIEDKQSFGCVFVKVSMDGAPYLRKVDLKTYDNYKELSSALEKMFSCFTIGQCTSQGVQGKDGLSQSCLADLLHGSEYVLTYEDKDRDWMLVGDVPWDMFTNSCRRLRIMKGSDAIGLAPRVKEKSKNRNDLANQMQKPV
ncbi:auxin-responsive protein IAA17-like isoform X2 [Dioscorea cayenensis subsp. rotundata]|uniref:Auxin-responsive protein n=1 Tax=Dioscorea cayennensis subsp. rotundata TaxID=55577 RepID=A0AB40B7R3_DIOCR|nr:auxin-responsive protein IAA17-like isoform X2 [Dioscorea cayenensis subsp. rotundata]